LPGFAGVCCLPDGYRGSPQYASHELPAGAVIVDNEYPRCRCVSSLFHSIPFAVCAEAPVWK
jgi:hypothetical protein